MHSSTHRAARAVAFWRTGCPGNPDARAREVPNGYGRDAVPHKTEPPHRYCDRCGGPFAGDRRSFGSVIHLAVDCEIDGSAVRYNNLALVVRTRLRCPWISGPRLWPATSQSVHRRRIVDGLPSDGVPRESSVHRYPCGERGTNILRQRESSNQGIPDSPAVLGCSPRRGGRLPVDLRTNDTL